MRNLKYIFALACGTLMFASCNNDYPVFNDNDAFAAFETTSESIAENDSVGELIIPVTLASKAGIETTVDFAIVDSTAKNGVNFNVENASNTLTFTKAEPVQNIKIKVVNDDIFTGDLAFTIKLTNPKGVKLGKLSSCLVKISDDEHPLAFILGTMNASGNKYVSKAWVATTWTAKIEKDEKDLSKVWIYKLVDEYQSNKFPVYGFVNAEKTEIHIPIGQYTYDFSSQGYGYAVLNGWYGPTGEDAIPTGGYITGKIAADGTITIQDQIEIDLNNAANTASEGWLNVFDVGITFKKQ
jgi:hypothetical protein